MGQDVKDRHQRIYGALHRERTYNKEQDNVPKPAAASE